MLANPDDSQIRDMQRGRQAAGAAAAALVEPDMVVGLGTGDTAACFIHALAERVRGGLSGLRCVATSLRSAELGRMLGLPMIDLDALCPKTAPGPRSKDAPIAITVDGADEIDPSLRLIKGAGGALLFEKLVALASRELFIVADPSKRVQRLGEKRKLPVEVVAFGASHTLCRLRGLAGVLSAELRFSPTGPYVTDGNNRIIDVAMEKEADAAALHARMKALPGVIETGLFLHEATRVFIGAADGHVEVAVRDSRAS